MNRVGAPQSPTIPTTPGHDIVGNFDGNTPPLGYSVLLFSVLIDLVVKVNIYNVTRVSLASRIRIQNPCVIDHADADYQELLKPAASVISRRIGTLSESILVIAVLADSSAKKILIITGAILCSNASWYHYLRCAHVLTANWPTTELLIISVGNQCWLLAKGMVRTAFGKEWQGHSANYSGI
jgi:hypothetical protein